MLSRAKHTHVHTLVLIVLKGTELRGILVAICTIAVQKQQQRELILSTRTYLELSISEHSFQALPHSHLATIRDSASNRVKDKDQHWRLLSDHQTQKNKGGRRMKDKRRGRGGPGLDFVPS